MPNKSNLRRHLKVVVQSVDHRDQGRGVQDRDKKTKNNKELLVLIRNVHSI